MLGRWVCIGVMVSMTGIAGADIPAGQVDRNRMESKARHIFKQADADHSGTLDRAEQVDADVQAETEIQTLLKKHPVILPAVPEPKLADREAMTVAEFIQHFESLAGRMDATVRTQHIASRRLHPRGAPAPVPVAENDSVSYSGAFGRIRGVEEDGQEGVHRFYPDNSKSEQKTEDVSNSSGKLTQPASGGFSIPSNPGPKVPNQNKVSGGNKPNGGGEVSKSPPKERPERPVPKFEKLDKKEDKPRERKEEKKEERRPREKEERRSKDKDEKGGGRK